MEQNVSAREWGREQAHTSPQWSEEKWRRIGRIFQVDFVAKQEETDHDSRDAA